jgi:hypothetical protein
MENDETQYFFNSPFFILKFSIPPYGHLKKFVAPEPFPPGKQARRRLRT